MQDGSTKSKGRPRVAALDPETSAGFRFQVGLCYEELVPRLKRLSRELDARAIIFGLMCHLGWGLQAAQLLGSCTAKQTHRLLERSCPRGLGKANSNEPPLQIDAVELIPPPRQPEPDAEDPGAFDIDAAEAFSKIARWISPMSKATSDLVVFTCLADVLAHVLDGQDERVIEGVREWLTELALSPACCS